jgi:hypothetical protein
MKEDEYRKIANKLGREYISPSLDFYENGRAETEPPYIVKTEFGLNKREHFASLFLQGIASNPDLTIFGVSAEQKIINDAAKKAIMLADALLLELAKQY